MPLEELDIVLEKFDRHIKFFSINGGEPTLHPEITEILKRSIEKLGGKRVIMATNGKNLGGIPENILREMRIIFFSFYLGKNDEELKIAKKKKSAGINIEIKQVSTFNDPSVLPDLSEISKSFLEFASSHCAKRQYRIVNGHVYGCVFAPLIERMYNIEGLGIPLRDFKLKMKIPCIEACKYCYVIAKYLNNRYNEVDPNYVNPAMAGEAAGLLN